jgi:uncharacterized protein DUF6062
MTNTRELRTGLAEDLRHAITREGCPVCRVLRSDEERYWDGLLYEGFQDHGVLNAYRAAAGICARHLAQLAARDDHFAAAKLAHASLQGAIDAVQHTKRRGRWRRPTELPRPGRACPVCEALRRHEAHGLDTLTQILDTEHDTHQQFATSDGLCLGHLGLALLGRRPVTDALRERLLTVAAQRTADVQRFLDAHDYRASSLAGDDAQSWRRAFALLQDTPGRVGDKR